MTAMLRVGVVGLGLMGLRHTQILRARSDVEVCGGVDLSPQACARFAALSGGAVAHTQLQDLLDRKPDAVIVSLPDNAHCDAVCSALEAGCDVLVEKPLATDVAEGLRMVRAADSSGHLLTVGFTLRFDPRYRAAAVAVSQGRVGEITLVHARRNSARGATRRYGRTTALPWHVSVHDIDAIVAVTGQRIAEVTARAGPVTSEDGHLRALGALLALENGAPAVLESSWDLPTAFGSAIDSRLEVVGTDGVIEVAGMDEGLRVVDGTGFDFPDVLRYQEDGGTGPGGALVHEVDHFLTACRRGTSEARHLPEALHVTEVVAALEASIESGESISLNLESDGGPHHPIPVQPRF